MTENAERGPLPLSDAEREAISWWFRRISTTLLIGNAGGIVALAGFAGNVENAALGAILAYPAIAYYFTGLFFSFASFPLQFCYAFLRIDRIAETDAKNISSRNLDDDPIRINIAATLFFSIYSILMFMFLFAGGYYFYTGARAITNATNAMACASAPEGAACLNSPSWIFGSPSPAAVDAGRRLLSRNDDKTSVVTVVEQADREAKLQSRSGGPEGPAGSTASE